MNTEPKMKTFIIQERFTGYADIHIEAKTEDEAIALYNRGHYKDSDYHSDDMFYNFEFDSISEMENFILLFYLHILDLKLIV